MRPSASDFTRQMVTCAMGVDEPAVAEWLRVYVDTVDEEWTKAFKRLDAFWDACSEEEQEAIAGYFGWIEPTGERFPFAYRIQSDFEDVIEVVGGLLLALEIRQEV